MGNVPVWVYVLFFFLLYLGIKRCYTRVVSVDRIAIMPAVFLFFSLRSTISLFHFSLFGLLLLVSGGLVGAYFGNKLVKNRNIRADKNKRLIEIPGDMSMLVMILTIFFIEFFIHYAVDANWAISQHAFFKHVAVILSGFVAGVSVGRSLTYLLKYRKGGSVDLV